MLEIENRKANPNYIGYNRLPFLGDLFRRLDGVVEKIGVQRIALETLNKVGVNLKVRMSDNARGVLTNERAIVVATHPNVVEVVAVVASLIPRKDLYLIGGLDATTIGENISRFVIPVSPQRAVNGKGVNFLARVAEIIKLGPEWNLTDKERFELNMRGLEKVREVIENGGLVVLFPDAGRKQEVKWFSGIGHLAKGVINADPYLIWCHVDGASIKDLIRVVPGMEKILPRPNINVAFSEPRRLSDFMMSGMGARKLTAFFQNEYIRWVNNVRRGQVGSK